MHACVAVARTALAEEHQVVGIMDGYEGLLNELFFVDSSVSSDPGRSAEYWLGART